MDLIIHYKREVSQPMKCLEFKRAAISMVILLSFCSLSIAQDVVHKTYGNRDMHVREIRIERSSISDARKNIFLDAMESRFILDFDEDSGILIDLLRGCSSYDEIVYRYDENGKIIDWRSYDADGATRERRSYTYRGEKLAEVAHYFDENLKLREEIYHSDNNVFIHEIAYSQDDFVGDKVIGKFHRATQWYNPNGSAYKVETYRSGGSLDVRRTYELSMNRMVTAMQYTVGGVIQRQRVYRYNEMFDLLSEEEYDASGMLQKKIEYKYEFDHEGRWVRRIILWWDQSLIDDEPQPFYVESRNIEYW